MNTRIGLAMVLATCACGDNKDTSGGGGGAADAQTMGQDAGSSGNDAGQQTDGGIPQRPASCDPQYPWVVQLSGQVIDETDQTMADALVQMCVWAAGSQGGAVCLSPVFTDNQGHFSYELPDGFRCVDRVKVRVAEDGYAATYCALNIQDGPTVSLNEPFRLFAVPAGNLPPFGDPNTARTATLADGLEVDITPAAFAFGEQSRYEALAGRRVTDSAPTPCFLEANHDYDGVYAFTVDEDILQFSGAMLRSFPIRIPNTTGLNPGTVVDLFALGPLSCQLDNGESIEEGKLESYGEATVNNTGDFIEGGVIPCFNWFAYKAR